MSDTNRPPTRLRASWLLALLCIVATPAAAQQFALSLPFEEYQPQQMANVQCRFPAKYRPKQLSFRLLGPGLTPDGQPVPFGAPHELDNALNHGMCPSVVVPSSPGRYEIRMFDRDRLLASASFTVVVSPEVTAGAMTRAGDAGAAPSSEGGAATDSLRTIADPSARLTAYREHILARLAAMDALYFGPENARTTMLRMNGGAEGPGSQSHYHYVRWDWGQRLRDFYLRHAKALTDSLEIAAKRGGVDGSWLSTADSGMGCWDAHESRVQGDFERYAGMWARASTYQVENWDKRQAEFGLDELGHKVCFAAMPDRPPTAATAAGAVALRFVVPKDGGYVPVPGGVVTHGELLLLEAEFAAATHCGQDVALDLGGGNATTVKLAAVAGQPKLCRSEPLRIEKPGN
jgi:hypothetical protein